MTQPLKDYQLFKEMEIIREITHHTACQVKNDRKR